MSSTVNYSPISLNIPSYTSRFQPEQFVEEGQIYNNRNMGNIAGQRDHLRERMDSLSERLRASEKLLIQQQKTLDSIKKSRDIALKLYNKLLKTISKNNTDTIAVSKPAIHSSEISQSHNVSESFDMKAVKVDATQKLGDILFNKYKDENESVAANIRTRFFQDLSYDSTKQLVSEATGLFDIFTHFMNYL